MDLRKSREEKCKLCLAMGAGRLWGIAQQVHQARHLSFILKQQGTTEVQTGRTDNGEHALKDK
jgi:hypothetical protein